jgi:ribosome-interacting GTPase 1
MRVQPELSKEQTTVGVEVVRSLQARPPLLPLSHPTHPVFPKPVARTCNLIFIILDVLKPLGDKKIIETELEGFGIRLNKKPPAIIVRRKDKGGIAITNTVPLTNIDHDEIKAILSEYRIANADVAIRQPNATADDLVDVVEGNRVYIPAIYVSPTHPLTSFVISDQLHSGSKQGTQTISFS